MKSNDAVSTRVPLVLFGVPFDNVNFEEAVGWVAERIRSGRPACVTTPNLDFLSQAWRDPELQRILIESDLVIADGWPIVAASSRFGPRLKERVTGSDLTPRLAERAAREGWRVYLLGGREGVPERAAAALKARYPKLKVVGTFSPPYAPLHEMNHEDLRRRLREAAPDLLLVAFGAPKQEKWINMHFRDWDVPVAIGVGGTFDFLAGTQRRAPRAFQKLRMEWLWRMLSDPKRLAGRYARNAAFLLGASHRIAKARRTPDAEVPPAESKLPWDRVGAVFRMMPSLARERNAAAWVAETVKEITPARPSVVIDLGERPWLSSLELGAMIEVRKGCREAGGEFVAVRPRPKVHRVLSTCRLDHYMEVLADAATACSLLEKRAAWKTGAGVEVESGRMRVRLPRELTAVEVPGLRSRCEAMWEQWRPLESCEIDASGLDFLDSAAVGMLAGLKKRADVDGVAWSCHGFGEKPLRILRVARVEKILVTG
ncbi:WecB/TagA/CpsF family glycosyltransferase [Kiritimatiella glycovorans]|uniref:N-acetylmannosaminyltransferase n=1 Tax=Kiritimatiella glycovorans TaxID=1307763 RepID=A0A0G3EEX5_9BACT|nr:WecB/TagA/CpsF family glycosyltransferase [Kiritimatiella glycovorans]AKJ65026.1 Putative N-acetylmannosaminyltransferase [Kiritimatiella glycovorans]